MRKSALLALASLFFAGAACAEPFEGRVVTVFDGDTLEVLVDGAPRRIRVAGIDTPERGQPWADRAKRALAARVAGRDVRVNAIDVDRYGRTVGEVYADDVCVGCELVREGHAWVYRGLARDPVLYELEEEARAHRRGLWGLPEAERVPPWEWRRGKRAREAPLPEDRAPFSPTCGAKRYCREMESCEEALFHLEQCGLDRIDGDGDGIPCEVLCDPR